MKRIIYYLLSAILLYSCTGQETPDGYGLLQVSSFGIETQADVQPLKRSADSRLQVDICQGATVVRTYTAGSSELDAPISLPVGNYTLHAHTPDMNEAANNEQGIPVYSVSTDFSIAEGETTAVEPLTARQVNIGILLQYSDELFGTAFSHVACTLTSPSGRTVTIEGFDNTNPTYFNLPDGGQLQYTFSLTNTDNENYTLGPKVIQVESGKNYHISMTRQ